MEKVLKTTSFCIWSAQAGKQEKETNLGILCKSLDARAGRVSTPQPHNELSRRQSLLNTLEAWRTLMAMVATMIPIADWCISSEHLDRLKQLTFVAQFSDLQILFPASLH